MEERRLSGILDDYKSGALDLDGAMALLKDYPEADLGFARLDTQRSVRVGFPEVIYCAGKTTHQIVTIVERCAKAGGNVLATRAERPIFAAVRRKFPKAEYNERARTICLRQRPAEPSAGRIAIVAAGTSDIPVAEEARVTAEIMDQVTQTYYDVGVAGIHRLLGFSAELQAANVVIVTAGMEGALASVVGGLVDSPVIAVPTSVGYGASFHGLAPLLTMLNSCAAGVAVVNIDNGFAAGYMAALINRRTEAGPDEAPAPPTPCKTKKRSGKRA